MLFNILVHVVGCDCVNVVENCLLYLCMLLDLLVGVVECRLMLVDVFGCLC